MSPVCSSGNWRPWILRQKSVVPHSSWPVSTFFILPSFSKLCVILQSSVSALLSFLASQLFSFAQAPAAPPPSKLRPSRSRHQKPLGLIIGLSNRISLNMYKLKHTSMALLQNFLFQVKSLSLTRELDEVYFKVALQ